jgi:hypothetical protein
MNCLQENPQDQAICKCGGRHFVFGDHVGVDEKGVFCECGCREFTMTFHMNSHPIYNKTYKCTCGHSFGVQYYCKGYDD